MPTRQPPADTSRSEIASILRRDSWATSTMMMCRLPLSRGLTRAWQTCAFACFPPVRELELMPSPVCSTAGGCDQAQGCCGDSKQCVPDCLDVDVRGASSGRRREDQPYAIPTFLAARQPLAAPMSTVCAPRVSQNPASLHPTAGWVLMVVNSDTSL